MRVWNKKKDLATQFLNQDPEMGLMIQDHVKTIINEEMIYDVEREGDDE